jgi:hypothetical protein
MMIVEKPNSQSRALLDLVGLEMRDLGDVSGGDLKLSSLALPVPGTNAGIQSTV